MNVGCGVDINQLVESEYAYERIVGGTFDLLAICDCKKLMILSLPNAGQKKKYELTIEEDTLKISLQRESVSSKYTCARVSRAVTVNGNTIPETDRRFLKTMVEILEDIRDHRAEMLTTTKGVS